MLIYLSQQQIELLRGVWRLLTRVEIEIRIDYF